MTTPVSWWWVRHGPTHAKCMVGWRDVPADLSDTAAIARLSAYLPSQATVVSSDLLRAVSTADAVAGSRVRLPHQQSLREFNFGDWDGLHWNEVATCDPTLSRAFWEDPGVHQAPNGESWNQLATRVSDTVDLINTSGHHHVIAVAHFGVILTQIARAGGMTPYAALGHKIDNLSVTRLDWDGRLWSVHSINHQP
ncbi:histidine phosphatase family protein [Aliiroseovarius sp. F47248L]|uniref:histidine phosphatase family protein n=1 Tax=Aliiroseovarius sp. F47248L TaxID=2926420 RepID=UPI001FF3057D|nr:histidine phosphatase family protein [Aliiroseovarius sp. F47248L]MCK0137670.1 histidine phosphatase family protein [Aliiroseovarius sp. F47248L]